MEDEDEAKVAIAELNGYELEGMNIKVEVRTEKQIYFNSVVTVSKCFLSVGFGRFCRKDLGFRFGFIFS